jgi:hypothetical protein
MTKRDELRELQAPELDGVSGASPALIAAFLGGALVSTLAGKVVEGVLESTGVTTQVLSVKGGKVTFLGQSLR